MRWFKEFSNNLLIQFTVVAVVASVLAAMGLALVLANQIDRWAIEDVEAHALSISRGPLTQFFTPTDFEGVPSQARYDQIDEFIRRFVASSRIARIKVWDDEGRVLYSTNRSQVGQSFPIKAELASALNGGVGRKLSVPQDVENERERYLGTLFEVYVPVQFRGETKPIGAFEVYEFYAPVADRITALQRRVYVGVAVSFVTLYITLLALVWRAWRTIEDQRQLLEGRTREIQALNGLLQTRLNVLYGGLQSILHVARFAPPPQSYDEARLECQTLIRRITDVLANA